MPSPILRVTRRCLEDDLGLNGDWVGKDAREFQGEHPAVKKFVDMRGASPDTAEPIYGPYPRGRICSLHVGSARAATAWEEAEDVCWLLAYNDFHRNGHPDDAYKVFNALYSAGQLLPTDKDWAKLDEDEEDEFLDKLQQAGETLLERARANPGREEVKTWHDGGRQVMCVDLLVESDGQAEEGWMGLTLPENEALTDQEVFDLVVGLLPPNVEPLYSHKFKDRDRRRGEIVYRWEHYTSHDAGGGSDDPYQGQ